jgi:hypothetical protein
MRPARCLSLATLLLLAAAALPAQSGGKGRPFEVAAGDVTTGAETTASSPSWRSR